MPLTPLMSIDWPFLVLAVVVGLLVFTWPAYGKLIRACTAAQAEGDIGRALDLALRIRQSRLPMAILVRLLMRGHAEFTIAMAYHTLGEVGDAIYWAERGLCIARKPQIRVMLHFVTAHACGERQQLENVESHLARCRAIISKGSCPGLDYPALAGACYYDAGRLDRAFDTFQDGVRQRQGTMSATLVASGLLSLGALGRFDQVLGLAQSMLEGQDLTTSPASESPVDAVKRGSELEEPRKPSNRVVESYMVFAALSAAEWSERWDLYERYLEVAQAATSPSVRIRPILLGYQAIWAAHNGHVDEVGALTSAIRDLTASYPRDRRLRNDQREMLMRVWHHLGAHERVVAEFANAAPEEFSLVDRSRMAALAADSYEALGQNEKALACRQEAKRLVPLAWWNRAPADQGLPAVEESALLAPETTRMAMQPSASAKPMLADGPVAPVASGVACAVWVVAVFALVPVLAVVAAPVLVTLCIILLARRERLAHDRRVALAGLVLAGWSLCFHLAAVAHHLTMPRARWSSQEPAFAQAGLANLDELVNTQPADDNDTVLSSQPEMDDETLPDPREYPMVDSEEEHADASTDFRLSWPQRIVLLAVLMISVMLHEIGHALASLWSGDPTAKELRRLSLNPIRHVDLVGSIIVPIVLTILPGSVVIGWAKPVPFRYQRLRRPRRGRLAISLAGVSVNVLLALAGTSVLALVLMALVRSYPHTVLGTRLWGFGPLHLPAVSHEGVWVGAIQVCKVIILVNGLLAGFNLLPIPPLDGFHFLQAIAPRPVAALLGKLSGLGMVLLFVLIAVGALKVLLLPAIVTSAVLLVLAQAFAGIPI